MKKGTFIIAIFMVLFSYAVTFGQVHSGPATGNIAAGVIVSTDNFPMVPIGMEPQKEQRVIKYMENDNEPIMGEIGDPKDFDNYVYVEDGNTHAGINGDVGENFMLHSFPSIPMTNSIPPDNHMAVGPDHVIAIVNSRFHIYDREGNLLKNIDADAWCTPALPNPGAFDPQILYDHYEGRWFMLWDSQDDGSQTAHFIISYSDDENPIGTWYMYAIDSRTNGNTITSTWGDYPQIGYDNQGIYINSRQFGFAGGYFYNKIRIINKSELYAANAGPLSWTDFWSISDPGQSSSKLDILHPVFSYDEQDNAAYFLWANRNGSTFYVLYKITDPITTPVLTGLRLFGTFYGPAPDANQLGGGSPRISTNGSHIKTTPILRDGKLYGTHSIRNTQHTAYTSLKYLVIDVNTNAFLEETELGAEGYFYIYPAIAVDKDHNIAITYSRSADTEYCGAYYSTKLASDPPGTLSSSQVMMEGQGNYVVTFGGSRNRWGDYLSAALDPVNQYDIWLYSEYVAATNTWGTWLTEIRMKPYDGASFYTAVNPVEYDPIEVGTTPVSKIITITNYGENDLVINNITSPAGPFTLLSNPSPVTLSTYDSLDLEIEFDPSTPAIYSELMAFDDNDPNFDGLILNGTGFEINPAFTGVLYSSTGLTENGIVLNVNMNNGVGIELGPSNFEELSSLTIDPVTNVLYGISSGSSETELVRVNASGGDAFTQYTLDLGSMVGIAFDSSGTLYAAVQVGDIYTIDLSNGSYSLITTANIQLSAITFNPLTNQMWAAPKVIIGVKDKIYTIDLTTGEGTLIGQTGFGILTNDLAFDENGTFYGVIGGAHEGGQLITINTTDGSGTLVGDIGFQNVVGLAYTITGEPSSVNPDKDKNFLPREFALSQNYPNPFNPSTSIEFSVPVDANVTLTIYNLLGQIVTTLVNEDIGAGHYSAVWNGADDNGFQVSSGIYFYEMKANGNNGKAYSQMKKMVFLK